MLQTLRNAWRIEELRKKIVFTLVIILLYRIGNAIPVPYVNVSQLSNYFSYMQNTVLGLLNVMSGSAFRRQQSLRCPSSLISMHPLLSSCSASRFLHWKG